MDNVWQQSRSLWDESGLKAVTGDFCYSAAIVVQKHMSRAVAHVPSHHNEGKSRWCSWIHNWK